MSVEKYTEREIKWLNRVQVIERGSLSLIQETPSLRYDEDFIKTVGRQIANTISDAGPRWSRLITIEALDYLTEHPTTTLITDDHPHSRQVIGERFIRDITFATMKPSPPRRLLNLLLISERSIKMLRYQNNELSKHQSRFRNFFQSYYNYGIKRLVFISPKLTYWKTYTKSNPWRKDKHYQIVPLSKAEQILLTAK